jgi:hypothetical protein
MNPVTQSSQAGAKPSKRGCQRVLTLSVNVVNTLGALLPRHNTLSQLGFPQRLLQNVHYDGLAMFRRINGAVAECQHVGVGGGGHGSRNEESHLNLWSIPRDGVSSRGSQNTNNPDSQPRLRIGVEVLSCYTSRPERDGSCHEINHRCRRAGDRRPDHTWCSCRSRRARR